MNADTARKFLVIRFSSLGDIVQCLSSAAQIKKVHPNCQVHWAVRSDMSALVSHSADVDQVFELDRRQGFSGLIELALKLRQQKYTHIYDAHSNVRSHLLCWMLRPPLLSLLSSVQFVRRPKSRLARWLLFKWRVNLFPQPFRGALSYLTPLKPWGIDTSAERQVLHLAATAKTEALGDQLSKAILLAPSAAWDNKRWPIQHWKQLISLLPDHTFFLLGGPEDTFCQEIAESAPERVTNLAGALNWEESAFCIQQGQALVSGDTGLFHIADLLGKPTVGLIGPSAFGYPSRSSSEVVEIELKCKPCSKDGRDPCSHAEIKHCMVAITPESVKKSLEKILPS